MIQEEHYLKKELYDLIQKDPLFFDFVQSGSLDGIWYWDLENPEHEWMNPQFWETLGYDSRDKEHLSSEWQDMIHPDDLNVALKNFALHCKNPNYPYDQIVRYWHKDGHTVWIRCRGVAVRDNKGNPIRMLGAHTDITQLKQFEAELYAGRERYRQMVDSSPVGIVTIGPQGQLIETNPFFCEMLDYQFVDLSKMHISDITHPGDREREKALLKRLIDNETPLAKYEKRLLNKNGAIVWGQLTVTVVRDEHRNPLCTLSLIEDVTDKKIAEKKQQELENKLEQSQKIIIQQEKLASIGQLAAGVAHEINNPIGFISQNLRSLAGYADKLATMIKAQRNVLEQLGHVDEDLKAMEKKLKLDFVLDDINDLIEESLDGSNRVQTIVNNLRAFSRKGDNESAYIDLNECIDGTIQIVWNELKYKADLKKNYGRIPNVKCHPQQMSQVFMNLIMNACQAIETKGKIDVCSWVDGSHAFVSISDDGCGISDRNIDRIFDPFFTTKEVGQGTGLGLSMVYDIVKEHQGEISVASEQDKGTIFTVMLPIDGILSD